MENVRELPQSPKNADASYPQDDLLADPVVFVSAIETGCEFPISGGVFVHFGVHQIKRHRPDIHPQTSTKT